MKILYSIIFLALSLVGCSEFLEKAPLGIESEETFFNDEEGGIKAVNSIYNSLRNWNLYGGFSYLSMGDICSDDADKGSTAQDAYAFVGVLNDFSYDASNGHILDFWTGRYQCISRANRLLDNIDKIKDIDENLKIRISGEAKFLRALMYFDLVTAFGDIRLITSSPKPDQYDSPKVSKDLVYKQIILDLKDAIKTLPKKSVYASTDMGRATKGAAQGLLAKVYLFMKDIPNSKKYIEEIINSAEYSLMSDYSKIFTREGENSSESVFEVQCAAFSQGGGSSPYNMIQGIRGPSNKGWGFNRPSDNLEAAFETGDPRKDATIIYVGEKLYDGTICLDNPEIENEKYNQKAYTPVHEGGQDNGPTNIRIIRYADVLLMAAEVYNESGNSALALKYLEEVRSRARNGNNGILPKIIETGQSKLRQIIWHERRVELAMEQHRWFDLVREGNAIEMMAKDGKTVLPKHLVFPIPQVEIDKSEGVLIQNLNW